MPRWRRRRGLCPGSRRAMCPGVTAMHTSLGDFLAQYTSAQQAYPATSFLPVDCPCGSACFRLQRAGSITRRICVKCSQVRYIDRFGDGVGWEEAVEDQGSEEPFCCDRCGGTEAYVCMGFSGYPEVPDLNGVKWFYVGVRCRACGLDSCFNDGKVGRSPLAESVFREVAGMLSR